MQFAFTSNQTETEVDTTSSQLALHLTIDGIALLSISPTFYKQLLHQYLLSKKLQLPNCI
jgi:hypothetical protein